MTAVDMLFDDSDLIGLIVIEIVAGESDRASAPARSNDSRHLLDDSRNNMPMYHDMSVMSIIQRREENRDVLVHHVCSC